MPEQNAKVASAGMLSPRACLLEGVMQSGATTRYSTTHLQSAASAACEALHKSLLVPSPSSCLQGGAHLPRKEVSQLLSTRVDKSLTKGLSAVGLAAMCAEPAAAHARPACCGWHCLVAPSALEGSALSF